jgi:hypothetical protein
MLSIPLIPQENPITPHIQKTTIYHYQSLKMQQQAKEKL